MRNFIKKLFKKQYYNIECVTFEELDLKKKVNVIRLENIRQRKINPNITNTECIMIGTLEARRLRKMF